MACADPDNNFALVAAALSSMTNREIVTKTKYEYLQREARSGKASGYVFKGVVDVPKLVEQTYLDFGQVTRRNFVRKCDSAPLLDVAILVEVAVLGVVGLVFRENVQVTRRNFVRKCDSAPLLDVAILVEVAVLGVVGLVFRENVQVTRRNFVRKCDSVQILISSSEGETSLVMQSNKDTIQQLKVCIQGKLGVKPESQCLSYQGIPLEDTNTLESYNITNNSTITLSLRIRGGSIELYLLDSTYLDPKWDYDFTDKSDGDTKFMRGGYPYYRPCGWKRIAIKVTGKNSDEKWLGHTGAEGEWSVTYHGTKKGAFDNICDEGYKVGEGAAYGKGVYSAPKIDETKRYATKFPFNGVEYLGIFQNRVNPKGVTIVNDGKYWICPDPKDIRPYGLCVKRH